MRSGIILFCCFTALLIVAASQDAFSLDPHKTIDERVSAESGVPSANRIMDY